MKKKLDKSFKESMPQVVEVHQVKCYNKENPVWQTNADKKDALKEIANNINICFNRAKECNIQWSKGLFVVKTRNVLHS